MTFSRFFLALLIFSTISCARDKKLTDGGGPKGNGGGGSVTPLSDDFMKSLPVNLSEGENSKLCSSKYPESFIRAKQEEFPTLLAKTTSVVYKPGSKSCYTVGQELPLGTGFDGKTKTVVNPSTETVIVKKVVLTTVELITESELSQLGTTREKLKTDLDASNTGMKVTEHPEIFMLVYFSPKTINKLELISTTPVVDNKPNPNKPITPIPDDFIKSLPIDLHEGDNSKLCSSKYPESFIRAKQEDFPALLSKTTSVVYKPGSKSCYTVGQELPLGTGFDGKTKTVVNPSTETVIVKKVVLTTVELITESELSQLGTTREKLKTDLDASNTGMKVTEHPEIFMLVYFSPKSINKLELTPATPIVDTKPQSPNPNPAKPVEPILQLPEVLGIEDNNNIGKSFSVCSKKTKNFIQTLSQTVTQNLVDGKTKLNIAPGKLTNCVRVGTILDTENKCKAKSDCSKRLYVEKIILKKNIDLTLDEAKQAGFETLEDLRSALDGEIKLMFNHEIEDDFDLVNLTYVKPSALN